MTLTFIVIGIDHRHAYGMTQHMIDVGAECLGYWTEGNPNTRIGLERRFPNVRRRKTVEDALEKGTGLWRNLFARRRVFGQYTGRLVHTGRTADMEGRPPYYSGQ